MTRIEHVHAREVLDSRGRPTVEVEMRLRGGAFGRAPVPSGASTGSAEALELRDGDPSRYDGQGVRKAVANVCQLIFKEIHGMDAADQESVDQRLILFDGTPNKARLGANALLGVSMACLKAAAAALARPTWAHVNQLSRALYDELPAVPCIPLPMVNMISGGLHAGGNLSFQDFLVNPHRAPDYSTALEWSVRIYCRLGRLLSEAGHEGRLVGDEGGYGPRLSGHRQALEFLMRAIEAAGLRPDYDVSFAIDVAATHFHRPDGYHLHPGEAWPASRMIDELDSLVRDFPIRSIEDGLAEDDWPGWAELTRRLGAKTTLIGDDSFVTNLYRLQKGIEQRSATGILIKMNQVGTITETVRAAHHARQAGFVRVVSARSGETEDDLLADLAVGLGADQIKIGSIVRSERLAKYNRLLRIEDELRSAGLSSGWPLERWSRTAD
jgi:enolase